MPGCCNWLRQTRVALVGNIVDAIFSPTRKVLESLLCVCEQVRRTHICGVP